MDEQTQSPDAQAEALPGNALALAEPSTVRTISRADAFLPAPWEELEMAAKMISTAPGLAVQFRRQEAALFVAYQAARWRADPVAVASKTYFTGDGERERVGYEAQLVHAIVESDPDLLEPLQFEYGYAGTAKTAGNRFCKVIGRVRGASKALTLTTPTVSQIKTKRSPLWFSDPDQQLSYYGSRAWARRYRPGRILGIYSADELADVAREQRAERPALFEEEDAEFDGIAPDDAPPGRAEGEGEPEDFPEVRAWAAAEHARIIALTEPEEVAAQWSAMIKNDLFGRFKAYDPANATAMLTSVKARRAALVKGRDHAR